MLIRGQLLWWGGRYILIVAAPRPSIARVDELGTCICVAVVVVASARSPSASYPLGANHPSVITACARVSLLGIRIRRMLDIGILGYSVVVVVGFD